MFRIFTNVKGKHAPHSSEKPVSGEHARRFALQLECREPTDEGCEAGEWRAVENCLAFPDARTGDVVLRYPHELQKVGTWSFRAVVAEREGDCFKRLAEIERERVAEPRSERPKAPLSLDEICLRTKSSCEAGVCAYSRAIGLNVAPSEPAEIQINEQWAGTEPLMLGSPLEAIALTFADPFGGIASGSDHGIQPKDYALRGPAAAHSRCWLELEGVCVELSLESAKLKKARGQGKAELTLEGVTLPVDALEKARLPLERSLPLENATLHLQLTPVIGAAERDGYTFLTYEVLPHTVNAPNSPQLVRCEQARAAARGHRTGLRILRWCFCKEWVV